MKPHNHQICFTLSPDAEPAGYWRAVADSYKQIFKTLESYGIAELRTFRGEQGEHHRVTFPLPRAVRRKLAAERRIREKEAKLQAAKHRREHPEEYDEDGVWIGPDYSEEDEA